MLIVEEYAHLLEGHFPVRFAQLADGYADLGFEVDVLTTWGWSRQQEVLAPRFRVHRFGAITRQLRRVATRLRAAGDSTSWRRFLNSVGDAFALLSMVAAARSRARRMHSRPEAIIVMGWDSEPALLAAIAGDGRWLVNQFRTPEEVHGWRSAGATACITAAARVSERRRRQRGHSFRVAAADAHWQKGWTARVPFLEPVVLPIAGARSMTKAPDARARLGLSDDARVALLFGDADAKRADTVVEAFSALEGWTLLIGGTVADTVDITHLDARSARAWPGLVDNETRDLLLSSADLMVLSFVADYHRNSGTLMDAISIGIPCVCSRRSAASDIVEAFELGVLFEPGDARSLADAVRAVPDAFASTALSHAREALSNRGVARAQLRVLGLSA